MKIPTSGLVPPNGWHFPVSEHHTITGESFSDLVTRLTVYRDQNSIPPGPSPTHEVAEYICTRWPHFCADASDIPALVLVKTCCGTTLKPTPRP